MSTIIQNEPSSFSDVIKHQIWKDAMTEEYESITPGWNLHQIDVKTTFLHGFIKEEVYMEQPKRFEIYDQKSHVCRLKKALYGLKQAP